MGGANVPHMRVLLVSGSGGVLLDLLALRPWWERHDAAWVAVRAADTSVALAGLPVIWERDPASWPQVVPAGWRARQVMRKRRPDLVVSAGRRVAVPYFLAARLLGIPSIWVETLTQVGPPSRGARLCSRLAGEVLVQRAGRPGAHVGELF